MRHRWFLVLAVGWVLLQPPPTLPIWTRLKIWLGFTVEKNVTRDTGTYDANLRAPWSEREYIGSYNTLAECEKQRDKVMSVYFNPPYQSEKPSSEELQQTARLTTYGYNLRCVPAVVQLK